MENIKPFKQIALKFALSDESAKYYLSRVQKSFKKEFPPHALISEFIEKRKFETLPRPYDLAKMMFDQGVWIHPMHGEPPVLEDEPDIYW